MFNFFRKTSGKQDVTVATTEGSSEEVDVRKFAGGSLTVSSGITALTLYGAHETGDTHLTYYDKDNYAVTLTVASTKITQLPEALYDLSFVKFIANASGTIYITLKS